MDQKQVLEKWLKQLQKGEITPDAIGLDTDKEEAIKQLKHEINKITIVKTVETVKNQEK
jgi:hypothetical protein